MLYNEHSTLIYKKKKVGGEDMGVADKQNHLISGIMPHGYLQRRPGHHDSLVWVIREGNDLGETSNKDNVITKFTHLSSKSKPGFPLLTILRTSHDPQSIVLSLGNTLESSGSLNN